MPRPTNIVSILREKERYVFLFDNLSLPQLRQFMGRFASDPEMTFTWHDAALLSTKANLLVMKADP